MNAERLHLIAVSLRKDFQKTQIQQNLDSIVNSLGNQVKQPSNSGHQKSVEADLKKLYDGLEKSITNKFTPVWMEILHEIGGIQFVGINLIREIKLIFERKNITPSVIQQELSLISERFKPFSASINQLCNAMNALQIGQETLEPGECEIGVVVPRGEVDNALADFGKELIQINKIFSVFSEISTDSRENFKIRTISSSDLTVFLEFVPEVAACTAVAIERIIALYKNLLEIKNLKKGLEAQGVNGEVIVGVDNHANSVMENGINELVECLLSEYHNNPDEARKNELRIETKVALNKLAKRIDRGYGFDVRIEPIVGDADIDDEREKFVSTVIKASENIQYIKPSGDPILNLPEVEQE